MSPLLTAYGTLGLAIIFEVTGSTFLAKSEQFTKPVPTLIMALFYATSFYFLAQALKVLPLGVAYAIWAGLGIILTATIGVLAFRQSLDIAAMGGIALIVSGVLVMNLFSKSVGHG